MISLTIDNSYCQLTGLSDRQFSQVRKLLSYEEKAYGASGHRSHTKHLMSKWGEFPSGLLDIVKAQLAVYQSKYEVIDLRTRPQPRLGLFTLSLGHTPYAAQKEAVEAVTAANGSGLVVAPTGSGKSLICALLVDVMKLKTLIVVPTLELKTQLTESMRLWFGETPNLTVANVDSLDPDKPCAADLVIIDEYHSSASKTYQRLNKKAWRGVYHRVGLTASPYRNKEFEHLLLQTIVSKTVYRLSYDRAVKDGYIVPAEFYYLEVPSTENDYFSYAEVKSSLVVNNPKRAEAVADIVAALDSAGESTLILVHEIRQGEAIQEALLAKGKDVALASGVSPHNRELLLEFNLKERKTLIATGVLGMGVDTKPCTYVILAAGGKSRPQLVQNVGRCLRTAPGKTVGTVILVRDKSHRFLERHFKITLKSIVEEYGQKAARL